MSNQEIYKYLKDNNIWYEITEHRAVYNMEELSQIDLPYKEVTGKNLFVRDDKKRNYYLITIKQDKKLNLKEFRKNNNTRPLSFVSKKDLINILNLTPGSITPLGLLNNKEANITFFIDKDFLSESHIIGVHPNDNTKTIWLKVEDLLTIIKKHQNPVHIIEI